jgi:putative hydrolase of the HAD superfamily
MRYKLLLFDADDTLFDYSKAESYALRSAFENFDIVFSTEYLSIYKDINKKIWLDLEKNVITPDKLKTERFIRLFRSLSIEKVDAGEFSRQYLNFLSRSIFLLPNVLGTVKNLHTKFKMAIITNGLKEVQRARFRSSEIFPYISEIIISDEIGIAKPDKKIFEYALNLMDHRDRSSVLMIGDSLTSDMQGGINSEIDTCWVNISGCKNETEINPKYEIKLITELLKIVY